MEKNPRIVRASWYLTEAQTCGGGVGRDGGINNIKLKKQNKTKQKAPLKLT